MTNDTIAGIRAFNRFYTTVIGVTNHHILESDYSLTEARAMFEVHNNPGMTARELKAELQVDEGYLSRLITKLVKNKILLKKQSKEDKRIFALELSENGKKTFSRLNNRSSEDIARLIDHLSSAEKAELLSHLDRIKTLLTKNEQHGHGHQ